jgi:hypothetical protein
MAATDTSGLYFTPLTSFALKLAIVGFSKLNDSFLFFFFSARLRSLASLKEYFNAMQYDWEKLHTSLKDLIVKTILSAEPGLVAAVRANVNSRRSVYELFGFDVLVDENLRPWLIEVVRFLILSVMSIPFKY